MKLKLIQNPPFEVDFKQFAPKVEPQQTVRLKEAAFTFFKAIQIFGACVGEGAWKALKDAPFQFKKIVLTTRNQVEQAIWPSNPFFFLLKAMHCPPAMLYNWASITQRLFYQRMNIKRDDFDLKPFMPSQNPWHIRCDELELDAGHVPKEIGVETLRRIFSEIEFSDRDSLHYKSLGEQSKKNLEAGLENFIQKVKDREPFLGTPSAYDVNRLLSFYQQIEDAVRLAIHESQKRLDLFYEKNGKDKLNYTWEQRQEYRNLFEDRVRIAIDLAIAGHHCGARFMGEAMQLYGYFSGEKTGVLGPEDYLIETLAQKRKKVLETLIEEDKGKENFGVDAHTYTKYIANLGPLLAIPGTKHVIETLDRSFNLERTLQRFFDAYSDDAIIDAVQEKIKSTQDFREMIIDWVKDRGRESDWNREYFNEEAENKSKIIQKILSEGVDLNNELSLLEDFKAAIQFLKNSRFQFPQIENWDDFLTELFSKEKFKEWRDLQYPKLGLIPKMKKIQEMKNFIAEKLGKDAASILKDFIYGDKDFKAESLISDLVIAKKIDKIRAIVDLPREKIRELIDKEADIKSALQDHYDFKRGVEFANLILGEDFKEKGLSSELLEWLLVSFGILLPQKEALED